MARRARDDFCLVCLNSPCTCGKTSKTRKTQPKLPSKVETVATPVKRAGLSAKHLPDSKQSTPPARVVIDNREAHRSEDGMGNSLADAVTLIVQILGVSESSIREHRSLISLSDNEIRAVQWRHRREYRAKGHDGGV